MMVMDHNTQKVAKLCQNLHVIFIQYHFGRTMAEQHALFVHNMDKTVKMDAQLHNFEDGTKRSSQKDLLGSVQYSVVR